jgi:hypothetical protein
MEETILKAFERGKWRVCNLKKDALVCLDLIAVVNYPTHGVQHPLIGMEYFVSFYRDDEYLFSTHCPNVFRKASELLNELTQERDEAGKKAALEILEKMAL